MRIIGYTLKRERLLELLAYNPDTGKFCRRVVAGGELPGAEPGTVVDGYRKISIDNQRYAGHRLAWFYVYGVWPSEIDHINRVKDDNRIANLRNVSRSVNNLNIPMKRNNTSGIRGVHWHKQTGKWAAAFRRNRKSFHVGVFATKQEAQAAYDVAIGGAV